MAGSKMAEMVPYDFFDAFVLEDHQDWVSDFSSIRKAFHVAVSASHLADHYFRFYSRHHKDFSKRYRTLRQFRTALTLRTSSFKVIQDMANALKHLYTFTSCSIASGGAIESLTYGESTIREEWRQDIGGATGSIVIRRRDKSVVRFAGAINDVIEVWRDVMNSGDQPAL